MIQRNSSNRLLSLDNSAALGTPPSSTSTARRRSPRGGRGPTSSFAVQEFGVPSSPRNINTNRTFARSRSRTPSPPCANPHHLLNGPGGRLPGGGAPLLPWRRGATEHVPRVDGEANNKERRARPRHYPLFMAMSWRKAVLGGTMGVCLVA
ncbi:unnamed protein product, partial [Discosporangium mesarthrocarpum]